MKKLVVSIFSLIIILFLSGSSFSQTTHDVTVTNFSFSPGELTITVGDAVRWTNVLGTHNVKADDNSFTSGPAAPAPWEFTHTFNAVGMNPYYCEPHGGPGGSGMAGVIIVQNPVGVDDEKLIADKFELLQNYPNPFNPTTKIKYSVPADGFVNIAIYNVLGDKVTEIVNSIQEAGNYEVTFDASKFASGMYLYRMESGSFVSVKKMMILK